MAQEEHPTDPKWLWIDPSGTDPILESRIKLGAVLLAEDIVYLVNNYNILINRDDFVEGGNFGAKLKGASYSMSPDPEEAWIFKTENGKPEPKRLTKKTDPEGPFFWVPKNSLVFIRLRQELRVPYYMIGRHNLKIRYVYNGLLLGTGPQVDPGYVGRMYIPLHNFTTDDIKVHINQSFVSIDFVRTTQLFRPEEEEPQSIEALYSKYRHTKRLLDLSKIEERITLSSYLGGNKPRSRLDELRQEIDVLIADTHTENEVGRQKLSEIKGTVRSDINSFREEQKEFQKSLFDRWDKLKVWEIAAVVGLIVITINLLNYFRVDENHLEKRFFDLQNQVTLSNRIEFANKLQAFGDSNRVFVEIASNQLVSTMLHASNTDFLTARSLDLDEARLQNLEASWGQFLRGAKSLSNSTVSPP